MGLFRLKENLEKGKKMELLYQKDFFLDLFIYPVFTIQQRLKKQTSSHFHYRSQSNQP